MIDGMRYPSRKLLVASVRAAAVSYVACTTTTVNPVAPDTVDSSASDAPTSGNLLVPADSSFAPLDFAPTEGAARRGRHLAWMESDAYLALAERSMREKVVGPLLARGVSIQAYNAAAD